VFILMNGGLNVEMVLVHVVILQLMNVVMNGNNVEVKIGQVLIVANRVLHVLQVMNGIHNV